MTDKNWQRNRLAHISSTLTSALDAALTEVCKMKGSEANAWLDEFERQQQLDAKNSVAEGLSFEEEAKSIESSLGVIHMIVSEIRKKISGEG
jgi:hypothetical protein